MATAPAGSPGYVQRRVAWTAAGAYAAPSVGAYFFYIPMWSILPGVYGKYFGLKLTDIALAILCIRVFDGLIDISIGYLADRRRSAGGSRKPWVVVGGIGSVVSCYFLFAPPPSVTVTYYMGWSFVYFLCFTIGEIPHLAWGSELTPDYHDRARVFATRNLFARLGLIAFYALPLLLTASAADYSPETLRTGVYIGGVAMACGLIWAILQAPAGLTHELTKPETAKLFLRSIVGNKPLLLFLAAFACIGVSSGMWYGLLYFYLDSYLKVGSDVALTLMVASIVAALSTPLWLRLIQRTNKSTAWAAGIALFVAQLAGMWCLTPHVAGWIPLCLVILANLYFAAHDVAAMSILGDIADYGKWKFGRDRTATYFALTNLVFKVMLGVGGGIALGLVGRAGFEPAASTHDAAAVVGLKVAFTILPACFSLVALWLIARTPIDQRRHRIIQRRLEARTPELYAPLLSITV